MFDSWVTCIAALHLSKAIFGGFLFCDTSVEGKKGLCNSPAVNILKMGIGYMEPRRGRPDLENIYVL